MRGLLAPLIRGFRKHPAPWILIALLLAAVGLRLYGINWDRGIPFTHHPDEQHILYKVQGPPPDGMGAPWVWGNLLNVKTSPLNPHNFNYGTFPMYTVKFLSWALSPLKEGLTAGRDMVYVGRAVSALYDVGTVLLVFLLASRLYRRRVGLLAAAFAAFTVIQIQNSHYATVDTTITFYVLLTLFFCTRIAFGHGGWNRVGLGIALGLALATKLTALPILLPVVLSFLMAASPEDKLRLRFPSRPELKKALLGLGVALAVALAVNFVAQPFAYLDWEEFKRDVARESTVLRGTWVVPYTLQYLNAPDYLYPIQQLAVWGAGLPLGIAMWAGFAFTLLRGVRRGKSELLLLSWSVPFFLIVGQMHAKFLRQFLPLIPILSIMAANMLFSWLDWAKTQHRWAIKAVIGLVLAGAVFYSLAYMNIYRQPHPSQRASQWVQQNVPLDSYILKETVWDQSLAAVDRYRNSTVEVYDGDGPAKASRIAGFLSEADYMVIWSNRAYGALGRPEAGHPMTARFYTLLFSGDLGYALAYSASSYPGFGGVSFVDDTFRRPGLPHPQGLKDPDGLAFNLGYADESYSVYDHPKILIFQNRGRLDAQNIEELLIGPAPRVEPGRMTPEDAIANREGGTWTDIFSPQSLPNRFPALAWLLLVEVIALAALPLALALFRPLADRGYLLAKALGILVIGFGAWLASSLHVLPFSQDSVFLALLGLALVSGYILIQDRAEFTAFLKARWKLLLSEEALFLAIFGLFLAIRMWNPDLWHPWRGGEKPMDFAYLNATIKSTYMPPYDPWFAGGAINYYYFGQFLLATLIKTTGILPEVAFNLAVPLLVAMTAGGAFTIVFNLVQAKGGRTYAAFLAGAGGVLFVVLLGNMDGAVQTVQGFKKVLDGQSFPPFDYWRSTRMLPPGDLAGITEFPFFTALFADLHAHFIALPFTLLALGVALAFALGRSARVSPWDWRARLDRNHLLLLLVASLVVGALRIMHTWDFPTYFAVMAAVLFLREYRHSQRLGPEVILWTAAKVALVYGLSYALYLPYHQNYEQYYGGFVGSRYKTPITRYLAIHALFLFLVVTLWMREMVHISSERLSLGGGRWWRILPLGGLVLALVIALGIVMAAYTQNVLALIVPLLALATPLAWSYLRRDDWTLLFVLGLAVLGLAVGLVVDYVTLKGDIERMNTVFKFYLQGWVLLGLAAAFSGWWLLRDLLTQVRQRRGRLSRAFWLTTLSLLLASSLAYPVFATPKRLGDRFTALSATLDGTAYAAKATFYDEGRPVPLAPDMEAIRWMRANIPGSPVVAEAITPFYRWGARVSVYTGLPGIVGWKWHQEQQRAGYAWQVGTRQAEVDTLFETQSQEKAMQLLAKYDVGYVYVGPLERLYYPAEGLAKFDAMLGEDLELVYPNSRAPNPEVKVYRVVTAYGTNDRH